MIKHKTSVIIAAAGEGSRMDSDAPKQLLKLNGTELLVMTLNVFSVCRAIDEIVVVTRNADIKTVKSLISAHGIKKVTAVISGGDSRQESIARSLLHINGEYVLIHDAARPFVTAEQITDIIDNIKAYGAAALGIPVTDTLKSVDDKSFIVKTVDRTSLVSIQTPQGFKTDIIRSAHEYAAQHGIKATDDCALCEEIGIPVKVIHGSPLNIKITYPDDLILAESILLIKKKGQAI